MTTKQKAVHTPGKWRQGQGAASCIVYAADGYAIADAKVFHGRHEGETEGNAALIASAPELLAALEMTDRAFRAILKLNATMGNPLEVSRDFHEERDAAQAAIRKARNA